MDLTKFSEEIHPVHLRHVIIRDDRHNGMIMQVFKRFLATIAGVNCEFPAIFKIYLKQGTEFLVIINEEYRNNSDHLVPGVPERAGSHSLSSAAGYKI